MGADAEISVALFSKVAVVLNVACSREVDVDVDVNVDLESPVADPVTELESARMALAAVEAEVCQASKAVSSLPPSNLKLSR